MSNRNVICVYDYETGGQFPHISQPTSLSCVMIDPIRLQVIQNGDFDSLIKPVLDKEECNKLGLEPLQQEALDITGIKVEDLEKAPCLKEVWTRFTEHVAKFSNGAGQWSKPVAAGYNIVNFDNVITNRICKEHGPYNKERDTNDIFHPRDCVDVMHIVWQIFENNKNNRSISFDTVRTHLGLSKVGAHSSIVDCRQNAAFLIRWLKWMRNTIPKLKLQDSMKDVDILDFYDVRPEV